MGDIVYFTNNPGSSWTGNYDGGEHYCPDGLYSWRIKAKGPGEIEAELFEGHLHIIR